MEKVRTRQEVKEEMTFIEAWKVYGFLETLMIKCPNFPLWIAIFALASSIIAPILRKALASMT